MNRTGTMHKFFFGTGALALALGSAVAQQPLLSHTLASTGAHRVADGQAPPEVSAPEAPQSSSPTPPPLKDDLFAGTEKFAKGASGVTEVTMDPESLDLVGGADAKRAHHMVLNVVRTYSYDKPGMYNMADVDEYRRRLEGGDWHCSVHIRDLKSGESTDVCSRRRAPDMVENAIITVAPKSLTFIHNIRKVNGQGGGLDLGGAFGVGGLPGLSLDASLAGLAPEMQAELLASTAELRARMPELQQQMRQFRFRFNSDPHWLDRQMQQFKFNSDPHWLDREMLRLQKTPPQQP